MEKRKEMLIEKTALEGVYLIKPDQALDRGDYFYETYTKCKLEPEISDTFVQDNESHIASKDTLKGFHCQVYPHAQSKIIRCSWGGIKDVVVDIRPDSPTYLKHISVQLTGQNRYQLYIPKGCLNGFVTLCDDVTVLYKTSDFYHPECEKRIPFDDPSFNIVWGVKKPNFSKAYKNANKYDPKDFKF